VKGQPDEKKRELKVTLRCS
jgi:hypothetical protein